jgi:hypothetical protein
VSYDLSDYVDVKTRLAQALDKYPQLRITEHRPAVVQVGDQLFIECAVTVARDPDDPVPVTAYMYEPFPGRTPYTKLSEQANSATSALGRALGYMGFGITASLASANEVRNRQEQPSRVDQIEDRRQAKAAAPGKITQGQIGLITTMSAEREMPVDEDAIADLSFDEAREMINHLKTIAKVKK